MVHAYRLCAQKIQSEHLEREQNRRNFNTECLVHTNSSDPVGCVPFNKMYSWSKESQFTQLPHKQGPVYLRVHLLLHSQRILINLVTER